MTMKSYAVIGEKLGHSMSPQIHNQIMDLIDVNGVYGILEVARENVPKIVDSFKLLNYSGVNVTVPYKQLIMPFLDEISPEAEAIGAINTITFKDDKAIGYNTDCFGFGIMLEQTGIDVAGKTISLCGAGGAGVAVITYLHNAKAKTIKIFSPVPEELEAAKTRFPFIETHDLSEKEAITGDILINSTPVGMFPKIDNSIVDKNIVARFSAVADTVYNPLETKIVKYAKELGLKACSGLWMLVYQAIKAQEIWQDIKIPAEFAQPIHSKLKKEFT